MTKKSIPFEDMSPEQQQAYRKGVVMGEWRKYQQTKDRRHLATICREMPFFGYPEVGKEIANLLTLEYDLPRLTGEPKIDKHRDAAILTALWNSWKGATWDGTDKKIPERIIMITIGKRLGIARDDDEKIYRTVLERLKALGLK
jgi:hypothetical protein